VRLSNQNALKALRLFYVGHTENLSKNNFKWSLWRNFEFFCVITVTKGKIKEFIHVFSEIIDNLIFSKNCILKNIRMTGRGGKDG